MGKPCLVAVVWLAVPLLTMTCSGCAGHSTGSSPDASGDASLAADGEPAGIGGAGGAGSDAASPVARDGVDGAAASFTPLDGYWYGPTNENLTARFTVSGSEVSNVIVGLKISMGGAPAIGYDCDANHVTAQIRDRQFSVDVVCLRFGGTPFVTVPVIGKFTSATTATGTVSSGTWEARLITPAPGGTGGAGGSGGAGTGGTSGNSGIDAGDAAGAASCDDCTKAQLCLEKLLPDAGPPPGKKSLKDSCEAATGSARQEFSTNCKIAAASPLCQ
jgi:hypothetical protein